MFENKKIFILGMARSGYEAAKILAKRGNTIVVNDMNLKQDESHIKELENLGVKVVLGAHPDDLLDETFDYLIKNPGIKFDHKYLIYCTTHNIKVINEQEMAYHLLPKNVKIIGITGTNGKTTTTTITYEIMKEYYKDRVHLCGNIGIPFCEVLNDIKENDYVVMEIGVPQLHDFYDFNADVAVLTNLYEAHLDMFKTREYYNENKKRIFMNHNSSNIAILNQNDSYVMNITKDIKSTKKFFNSKNKCDGCYISDNIIYYYDKKIIDTKDIFLKGIHNYENIMCAIMCSMEMNVPIEIIRKVISTFKGVEHRIEYVRSINGVSYYNDSKATNIMSTIIALSSFEGSVVLLLGGLERNQSFYELKDYLGKVREVVCYGECSDRIVKEMKDMSICTTKKDNLKQAVEYASSISKEGDTILLSPASASWDQYKCFEDRGNEFKDIVLSL